MPRINSRPEHRPLRQLHTAAHPASSKKAARAYHPRAPSLAIAYGVASNRSRKAPVPGGPLTSSTTEPFPGSTVKRNLKIVSFASEAGRPARGTRGQMHAVEGHVQGGDALPGNADTIAMAGIFGPSAGGCLTTCASAAGHPTSVRLHRPGRRFSPCSAPEALGLVDLISVMPCRRYKVRIFQIMSTENASMPSRTRGSIGT